MTPAKRKAFWEWLAAQGAEVVPPTNGYEVARFRAHGAVHVVYQKKTGDISAQGFALDALEAFAKGANLGMGYTGKRKTIDQERRAALLARDGDACFFCAKPMAPEDVSVEHLVAVGKGGPNHTDNLVLAHKACNLGVGNLPLIQKIQLYHRSRLPPGTPPPEPLPLPARSVKCRTCSDMVRPGENGDGRCFFCFINHRGEEAPQKESIA